MAADGIQSYVRYRVVDRSPKYWLKDGFENDGVPFPPFLGTLQQPYALIPFWKSIGTDPGTDNSIAYWNQIAGVWTYAGHVLTAPATVGAQIVAGNPDFNDGTFRCRFRWLTGAQVRPIVHCDGTANNFIFAAINGATLRLFKHVGGVDTQVGGAPAAVLTNNVNYWCEIQCVGTTYSVFLYNDNVGLISTTITSVTGQTIADAGVQTGFVGFHNPLAVSWSVGGANNGVCFWYGSMPAGLYQNWMPVVITGEPGFAWSKISPFAGTYHISIYLANAAGSGAWQQKVRLAAGSKVTISAQSKASAGTANITSGGLTTGNAGVVYGVVTGTGAMTANPTVSLNYSGAIGIAYFDELSILNSAYIITEDLPHPHQSNWKTVGMQPHNPSNASLGSFTIPLWPPRSSEFVAAKPIYDQLREYQRVEAYEGLSPTGIGKGKFINAGFINGLPKGKTESGGNYAITGIPDIVIANLSRPFPGEQLGVSYGTGLITAASLRQVRNYLGINEPGWCDDFSAYDSNNYNSVASPIGGVGTWTTDTDNGLPVIKCLVGTGAALLAKSGIRPGDGNSTGYVEIRGRFKPNTTDATNAGKFGLGLSFSGVDFLSEYNQTGFYILAFCTVKYNATSQRYDLNLNIQTGGPTTVFTNFLSSVDDTDGYIPFEMTLEVSNLDITYNSKGRIIVTVNGQTAVQSNTGGSVTGGQAILFPYLFYGNSATASQPTAYFNALYQFARYTDDGTDVSTFKLGASTSPTHSLPVRSDAGQTFLDMWSRIAVLENWFWRYTPQPFNPSLNGRTLGVVDFLPDPGADLSHSCIFSFDKGNVKDISLNANDDAVVSATSVTSLSGTDGGGVAGWRDIAATLTYGALADQTLFLASPTFAEQTLASRQIVQNKILVGTSGAKTAILIRDADTFGKWRELDIITLDDKDLNLPFLATRILSYTYEEGSIEQTVELDQFSVRNTTVPQRRTQQGVFQMAKTFGNR